MLKAQQALQLARDIGRKNAFEQERQERIEKILKKINLAIVDACSMGDTSLILHEGHDFSFTDEVLTCLRQHGYRCILNPTGVKGEYRIDWSEG